MKIGVLTYWTTNNNYGQLLQCYALQRALYSMGHDAFIIRYDPFNAKKSLLGKVRCLTPGKLISFVSGKWAKEKSQAAHITEMDALRRFGDFRTECLTVSDRAYSSLDELRLNPPEADVYICGSDQVWHNPLADSETAAWYLDFGDARRVSYAASISRELEENEIPIFVRYLSAFSAISLREPSATALCRKCGFPKAQTVLDPTLLLDGDAYPMSFSDSSGRGYVFAYLVNVTERDPALWDAVDEYARNCGLTIKPVYSSGYKVCKEFLAASYETEWPTVREWVGMLAESECVVTTSFHGVAMSIVMQRPFVAVLLSGVHEGANERLFGLLDSLGLAERMYREGDSFQEKMEAPINWDEVSLKLDALRDESYDYLRSALARGEKELV